MVVCACRLSYSGGINKRTEVLAGLGKNVRPH
jgi:hypothetical protein